MGEIIAALLAVLVATTFIPKFAQMQAASNANIQAAATAQQQQTFNSAATSYIQQNYVAIQSVATATVPAIITVPMLQAVNLLPGAFSPINPAGQTWQLQVLQPTAGNLQAFALTLGGTSYSDKQAAQIAALVGASGGFIPANDSGAYPGASTAAIGSFAGWSQSTANYSGIAGGQLSSLLTFNAGQLVSNYLYRNSVPGQPQLNTMTTPLIIASTQTSGAACATNGAIATSATGQVMSCVSGAWAIASGGQFWKDPVATFGALPATGNTTGDTRMARDTARAFMWMGAGWAALAVDQNGNMTVPGTLTAANGRVIAWNQPAEGGVVQLVGNNGQSMYVENNNGSFRLVNSAWNAVPFTVDQAGNTTAMGNITIQGNRLSGSGAANSYGATTITGDKNGWTGVAFHDRYGNYQITQMTNRSNIGYYDEASGRWLSYSDVSGNLTLDQTGDMNSGRINPGWAVETWGCSTGQIAKAAYTVQDGWAWNGKTLNCVGGQWQTPIVHGGGFMYRYTDGACVSPNPRTGACNCPWNTSGYNVSTAVNVPWWGPTAGYVCN